jgi:hypothetical protein
MNNPKSATAHLPFEIVYSYTRAQAVVGRDSRRAALPPLNFSRLDL